MNKTLLEAYKKRISSATPLELTNISFELFELYAKEARSCERDSDDFVKNIKKARDFVEMMETTLDKNYAVSIELSNIYQHVIKVLGDAIDNRELIFVDDAIRVIAPLKAAFKDIEDQGYGELNKNNLDTNIFAGLTYGKKGLNEYIDDSQGGHNFMG